MVLEGVEFVQLDIDDLLLAPAWSILWLFGSFRSGSGLYRWSRFFLRFLFDRLFRFLCGSFGLRGCVLVLICFRGRPRRFGCSGSLGFSSAFFGASGCFSGFSAFAGSGFSTPGSCRPFLDFLFLHNFSEVIDRNLWVLYLWFRLFFRLRGNGNLPPALLGGAGGVSLPGPLSVTGCSGVFVVLSSAISIYLLFFGMKKGAQLFSQAPWEVPPFSAMIQKYRP